MMTNMSNQWSQQHPRNEKSPKPIIYSRTTAGTAVVTYNSGKKKMTVAKQQKGTNSLVLREEIGLESILRWA